VENNVAGCFSKERGPSLTGDVSRTNSFSEAIMGKKSDFSVAGAVVYGVLYGIFGLGGLAIGIAILYAAWVFAGKPPI
jgi:hypothetical protein